MNMPTHRRIPAIAFVLIVAAASLPTAAANGAELDLRPITLTPEPLTQPHPKLQWLTRNKVRVIWIGDDLFDPLDDGGKTKAQVIADAGFNLVMVSMGPNSDDTPSGVVDTSQPPVCHNGLWLLDVFRFVRGGVGHASRWTFQLDDEFNSPTSVWVDDGKHDSRCRRRLAVVRLDTKVSPR